MSARKLRYAMIGGGRGAFIGAVHRMAARLDGQAELVAGAFSSDAERSRASGADLLLDPARVYGSCAEMVRAEKARPREQRPDFVVIVTPNDQHYAAARLCLESGFNVVLDKPVALDVAQALELREVVRRTRKVLVLTHNYTGHAMVKQARELVRTGALGEIRKIVAEYSQDWLATDLESTGQKQASWRTDPARAGAAGCLGDIGTHAHNLLRYVSGLELTELCADLSTFVPGRRVDDDGNILLRFAGGAKGVLHCSQIAAGEENRLSLRVYGTAASIEWHQEQPDELVVKYIGKPRESWRRGNGYLGDAAKLAGRIPPGHPEGYLEAFANIYREAFRAIAAEVAGEPPPTDLDCPTIDDGVAGMQFIEAALRSAREGGAWTRVQTPSQSSA
jgi:predicted dehydrogenase